MKRLCSLWETIIGIGVGIGIGVAIAVAVGFGSPQKPIAIATAIPIPTPTDRAFSSLLDIAKCKPTYELISNFRGSGTQQLYDRMLGVFELLMLSSPEVS